MAWYKIDLGCAAGARPQMHDILQSFQQSYESQGAPPAMAAFSRSVGAEDRLLLYFSPRAEEFAARLAGAVACESPNAGALTLVAGDPGTKSVFRTSARAEDSRSVAVDPASARSGRGQREPRRT